MPPVNPTISEDDLSDEIKAISEEGAPQTLSGTDADRVHSENDGAAEGSHLVERDFYNAQDGLRGRQGGRYLDVVERVAAEEDRAQREQRDPDYDNPPAAAGTTLVTDALRVDNPFSNPGSAEVAPVNDVDPVASLPVDIGVGTVDQDTTYAEQVMRENQAATTGQEVKPSPGPDNESNSGGGISASYGV